jgi:hypothetical protein
VACSNSSSIAFSDWRAGLNTAERQHQEAATPAIAPITSNVHFGFVVPSIIDPPKRKPTRVDPFTFYAICSAHSLFTEAKCGIVTADLRL